MFKLKVVNITPKGKYRPGIYYEYVKYVNKHSKVATIYKLIKVAIVEDVTYITFAWDHDEKPGQIDYMENWTNIKEFEGFMANGWYNEISNSDPRISEQLKSFEYVEVPYKIE